MLVAGSIPVPSASLFFRHKTPLMRIASQQIRWADLAQIAPYLLIAVCLAVLLVFVLLAQYAHPSSDDFCMASGVNDYGLFAHLWNHYLEWSGRYSGNALYAIYPVVFDLFDDYRFIPAIVIAALFLATAFFLSTLFATSLYARAVLLASLGFVCVYLLGMTSPASGLYWMAGAFTYQAANVLFLVTLGLMIRLAQRQKSSSSYFVLFIVLLLVVVVAIGANETSMIAVTGVALLGVLVHLRSGRAMLWPWMVILAVSLVSFDIVYFSPGNAIRAADFPLRHDLLRSINGSLSVGIKILWIWISNPVLIVSSMLAPFVISRLLQLSGGQPSGRSFNVSRPLLAVLLLCTFSMPIMLQFPAWWSMGGWPPARTLDAIYFLFLLSWFLTIGAFTVRFLHKDKWNWLKQPYHPYAAVAVFVLTALFSLAALESNAYKRAKNDLFHLARPYHEYLNTRYEYIERALANGQLYLVVADYQQEYPRTIFFNDIMHNADHWRNVCYADYFGLEKIKRSHNKRNSGRRELDKPPAIPDRGFL